MPRAKTPSIFSTVSFSTPRERDQLRERAGRVGEDGLVVGEGEHRLAAALEVDGERAVDDHDEGARLAPGPVALALRPGQGGAVRVRGIGRREGEHGSRRARALVLRDEGAQPVDGARGGELRGAELLDEVAAPGAALLLEAAEHLVGEREAAEHALGLHGAAGDDAVALEQHLAEGVPADRRV